MALSITVGQTIWDMVTLDATAGDVTEFVFDGPCDFIVDPRGADVWLYLAGTDGDAASGDYDIVYAGSKERIRIDHAMSVFVACPTVVSHPMAYRIERISR